MCDAPADGADAPRVSADGSRLVHVDCKRCCSRLEVRIPLALQLAGRDATVRCGACETLLQVSVLSPSPRSTAPASASDSRAMHAAAAAFLRHHPIEDDHSVPTTAASDGDDRVAMPSRAFDEQRRHMQLAQWHMNMAQRHSPPLGSLDVDSFFPYAPPPSAMQPGDGGVPTRQRDDVDQVLRQAAHDFWSGGDSARPAKFPRRERKPREPSSYNVFIREEIPRLKERDPSLNHRDAFKAAARNWAHSPLNLRSAAYRPESRTEAAAAADAASKTKRDVRMEIMAKLHPHLLRCRREDVGEDARAREVMPLEREGSEDVGAFSHEAGEIKIGEAEDARTSSFAVAEWVLETVVERATRLTASAVACVSSDKSTEGHAWGGEH